MNGLPLHHQNVESLASNGPSPSERSSYPNLKAIANLNRSISSSNLPPLRPMPQRSVTGGSELQQNMFSASPAGTPSVSLVEDPMEIQGSTTTNSHSQQRRAMTASPSVFSVDQAWSDTASGWGQSPGASNENPILTPSRSAATSSRRPPLLSHESGPAWVSSAGNASPSSMGWSKDVSSPVAELSLEQTSSPHRQRQAVAAAAQAAALRVSDSGPSGPPSSHSNATLPTQKSVAMAIESEGRRSSLSSEISGNELENSQRSTSSRHPVHSLQKRVPQRSTTLDPSSHLSRGGSGLGNELSESSADPSDVAAAMEALNLVHSSARANNSNGSSSNVSHQQQQNARSQPHRSQTQQVQPQPQRRQGGHSQNPSFGYGAGYQSPDAGSNGYAAPSSYSYSSARSPDPTAYAQAYDFYRATPDPYAPMPQAGQRGVYGSQAGSQRGSVPQSPQPNFASLQMQQAILAQQQQQQQQQQHQAGGSNDMMMYNYQNYAAAPQNQGYGNYASPAQMGMMMPQMQNGYQGQVPPSPMMGGGMQDKSMMQQSMYAHGSQPMASGLSDLGSPMMGGLSLQGNAGYYGNAARGSQIPQSSGWGTSSSGRVSRNGSGPSHRRIGTGSGNWSFPPIAAAQARQYQQPQQLQHQGVAGFGGRSELAMSNLGGFNGIAPTAEAVAAAAAAASAISTTGPRSAVLESFRSRSQTRNFELAEIQGHVVEFSADQHGSRFTQEKLDSASRAEKDMVFTELVPSARSLMTDVFGNYVIQKMFEHGTEDQRAVLASQMEGQILALSLGTYGCRVVQKALDHISPSQQIRFAQELSGNVLQCVQDQNANHVVQKMIETICLHTPSSINFFPAAFHGEVSRLAAHCYSCRVLQRIFEYCEKDIARPLLMELRQYTFDLMQDQYGNYVIQWVLTRGQPEDAQSVVQVTKGNLLKLSRHKFASNVVEQVVKEADPATQIDMIEEILQPAADPQRQQRAAAAAAAASLPAPPSKSSNPNENPNPNATPTHPNASPILACVMMMRDQYANYVLQRFLEIAKGDQRARLCVALKPHLASLRRHANGYAKHLQAVERLLSDDYIPI